MTNLFRCITCSKIIMSEEANGHSCETTINRYKTIEAISYFTVKNEKNEECIVIDALNGTGYTFVIKEPKLIPFSEVLSCDLIESKNKRSDGFFHREEPDGDSPVPLSSLQI